MWKQGFLKWNNYSFMFLPNWTYCMQCLKHHWFFTKQWDRLSICLCYLYTSLDLHDCSERRTSPIYTGHRWKAAKAGVVGSRHQLFDSQHIAQYEEGKCGSMTKRQRHYSYKKALWTRWQELCFQDLSQKIHTYENASYSTYLPRQDERLSQTCGDLNLWIQGI